MLDRDPPDHTRLRRLVARAFTPRTVQQQQHRVEQLVDTALTGLVEAGGGDLIEMLAFPLPFQVISELLGMPEMDLTHLRALSGTVVRSLEPVADPELMRAIHQADLELQRLLEDAIDWKRQHPGDDLLTGLIQAEDDGDLLTPDELVAQVGLLYLAGHETTVNLIGNGALALLHSPDQLQLLRDRPDLDDNAVEELLRYDSPVQLSRRVTLAELDLGGRIIPAGQVVIASLASANHDPAVFGSDADRVRLDRPTARQHVSFGGGVHHCLGASLARLEGRVALTQLARRCPRLDLSGEPVWNGRLNLRGLTHLPVQVGR